MVTTRTATNSLPAEIETIHDLQAAEAARPRKRAQKCTEANAVSVLQEAEAIRRKKRTTKRTTSGTEPTTPGPISSNTGSLTFLDLPPEIRNEIYAYALVQPGAIRVPQPSSKIKEPVLLAVSQQIRLETISTFYAENIFEIDGSSPAVKFLRSLSPLKLKSLRTLQIITSIMPTVEYAQKRIDQLMREFGNKGFREQAIRFLVNAGGTPIWASMDGLKRIEDDRDRNVCTSEDMSPTRKGSKSGSKEPSGEGKVSEFE